MSLLLFCMLPVGNGLVEKTKVLMFPLNAYQRNLMVKYDLVFFLESADNFFGHQRFLHKARTQQVSERKNKGGKDSTEAICDVVF